MARGEVACDPSRRSVTNRQPAPSSHAMPARPSGPLASDMPLYDSLCARDRGSAICDAPGSEPSNCTRRTRQFGSTLGSLSLLNATIAPSPSRSTDLNIASPGPSEICTLDPAANQPLHAVG